MRAKDGEQMQEFVRRLIDCGMTRSVALTMLRRIPTERERELYVETIEDENHEQMEVL